MNQNKKKLHFELLNTDFELLSTTVLQQLSITQDILNTGWQKDFEEKIIENEKLINSLDFSLMQILPTLIILYSPKAMDLRKIISLHEVIIYLEEVGNILMQIINLLKQTNLNLEDFQPLISFLNNMFETLKKIINSSTYSYYKEDKSEAHNILEKENNINSCTEELRNELIASFQEIPLSGQELINVIHLNTISYYIEKIKDNAINIAKGTIFVLEGTDLRHQNNQK